MIQLQVLFSYVKEYKKSLGLGPLTEHELESNYAQESVHNAPQAGKSYLKLV